MIGVDRPNGAGYRVWAPRYGRYAISDDGASIEAAVGRVPAWRWQRLLFAQVLPLTAVLRGLAVLHASSVALDGRAFAFVASSGTGKTSAALNLVTRGADLVTDDVLALSVSETEVLAHPGAGVVSVFASDLAALNGARLGPVIGADDKLHVGVPLVDRALPLSAVYILERDPSTPGLAVVPVAPPDPALLLGGAFISYLRSPRYLIAHLDVCARMSRLVPMFRVTVPPRADAGQLAAALLDHIRSVR